MSIFNYNDSLKDNNEYFSSINDISYSNYIYSNLNLPFNYYSEESKEENNFKYNKSILILKKECIDFEDGNSNHNNLFNNICKSKTEAILDENKNENSPIILPKSLLNNIIHNDNNINKLKQELLGKKREGTDISQGHSNFSDDNINIQNMNLIIF